MLSLNLMSLCVGDSKCHALFKNELGEIFEWHQNTLFPGEDGSGRKRRERGAGEGKSRTEGK